MEKKIEGVSIVVPVYNEQESIIPVIEGMLQAMEKRGIPVQVVVVDDGSTDRTREKVRVRYGNHPDVLLVEHQRNRGVGIARNTGIENAKFEIVGMIDADETYPTDVFPDMAEKMLEYDMVVGARRDEKGGMRFLRRCMKDFIRFLAGYLFATKIPDLNSGLRLFRKNLVRQYFYLLPPGHSWVSTITLAFLANGHSVYFFPIDYFPRIKGKSSFHPVRDTLNYLLLVLRACTYFDPLKIFAPIFVVLFILGSVKTVVDIILFQTIQESDIIIILVSLLLLAVGLLCDLIVMQGRKKR